MGRHSNLIKRAFGFDSNPWSKWADLDSPEPKLSADDLEGAPLPPPGAPHSAPGGVPSAAASSSDDIESLVDEFLASRGGGSTSSGAGRAGSNINNNYYFPGSYMPQSRRPKNIAIDIDGDISSRDLSRVLKQVSRLANGERPRMPQMMPMMPYMMPYMMPMMPYGMMPMMPQQKQEDTQPASAPDHASTLRDFIAYARSKGIDLTGATPATLPTPVAMPEAPKDTEKKYSEADLEKKKREIDAAVASEGTLRERYSGALEKAMQDRETNRTRWKRYRHWSPAIAAASTIGGGILADKLYSKYILKNEDPALQSTGDWWQRFLAARVGNVGGYALSMLPNMLLKPKHDLSTHAYPIPSEIK